jgi:hypothetical protein
MQNEIESIDDENGIPIISNKYIPPTIHKNASGKYHCENGPAFIHSDGSEEWYVNGKRHRIDAPAATYKLNDSIMEKWYKNGALHRIGGPAVSRKWIKDSHFFEGWYRNGKKHREDGPAMTWKSGEKEWYKNGKLHRTDGPAMILSDGGSRWFIDGYCHREDGPAIVNSDGREEWRRDGMKHRIFGPCITTENNTEEFWIYHEQMSEDWHILISFLVDLEIFCLYDILDLKTKYDLLNDELPSVINGKYSPIYHRNGLPESYDFPTIITSAGTEFWMASGELHREDGPAIVGQDWVQWFISGHYMEFDRWASLVHLSDEDKLFYSLKYSLMIK